MSIKVSFDPTFLGSWGKDFNTVDVTGGSVGECLSSLVKEMPGMKRVLFKENGKLVLSVIVHVNNESVWGDKLTKAVSDGDEIKLIPLNRDACCCHY